jgi:hypothetical protein
VNQENFPTLCVDDIDTSPPEQVLTPEILAAVEAAARTVCDRQGNRSGEHAVDGPLAFSICDLAKRTSIGKQSLYDAINARQLVARKLGRRTVILRADAESWLARAPMIEPLPAADNLDQLSKLKRLEPTGHSEPRRSQKNRLENAAAVGNARTPAGPPLGPASANANRDDFAARYREARALLVERWADEIIEIADDLSP